MSRGRNRSKLFESAKHEKSHITHNTKENGVSMTRGGNTRKTGARYELLAAVHLGKMWLSYHREKLSLPDREIDLVACDGAYLVFVEVKYRKNNKKGGAAAAVSTAKQKTISRVADYYMKVHGICADQSVRFDVVAFDGEEMELIRDAFAYAKCPV